MKQPTIEELKDKLNELILKHNDLARAVDNLCQAVDSINSVLLEEDEKPKKLDS